MGSCRPNFSVQLCGFFLEIKREWKGQSEMTRKSLTGEVGKAIFWGQFGQTSGENKFTAVDFECQTF